MAALIAFAVAIVATPAAAALARRAGIVDRPGPLKVQRTPVPYLGGVAVFVAIGVVVAAVQSAWLVPLGMALALGVADDVRGLTPWTRLAGEAVVGAVVAAIVATRFPAPIGPLLVVVMVVTLINAVNMLDGLDGLVAGLLLPAMGGAAILFTGSERDVALAAMGALAGFLLFNRPPARIYLGDGGSYLLGTLLGLMLAAAWAPGSRWSLGVAALVLLALPVAEIVVVVVRRLRAGQPIFEGDRSHSYDRLSDRGWSVGRIDIAAVAAQLVLVASGLLVAAR